MPRVAAGPQPSTAAAGRATTGPSTTAPTSSASDPSAARPMAPSGLDVAVTTPATPAPVRSAPTTARTLEAPERSTATSRRAASGATLDALIAGPTLANSVVPIPMIAAAITAPRLITRLASGMSRPFSITFWSSVAMPMPAPNPMAVDTTPTTRASAATPTITWRRDAPMARIRADSLVRWATRIENVLWMLNAATTIAIPAKASRIVLKNPRKSFSTSCSCSAVSSAPVIASSPSGRLAAMRLSRSVALTPSPARTSTDEIWVSLPARICCAVSVSNAT